jgi:hypothetical protein
MLSPFARTTGKEALVVIVPRLVFYRCRPDRPLPARAEHRSRCRMRLPDGAIGICLPEKKKT